MNEQSDLPEGSEVLLFPSDEHDELDDTDRAALHDALREAQAEVDKGLGVAWNSLMDEFRASRG